MDDLGGGFGMQQMLSDTRARRSAAGAARGVGSSLQAASVQSDSRWRRSWPSWRVSSSDRERAHYWQGATMQMSLSIGPVAALIAGILILIVPRLLNYIVAIYLIIIGLVGLFGAGSVHLP
jgi:hypothetical protein